MAGPAFVTTGGRNTATWPGKENVTEVPGDM